MDLFIDAYEATQHANGAVTTLITFEVLVARAILAAVGTGAHTATASTTGPTLANYNHVIELLQKNGYTISQSGTTLTVNWP